MLHPVAHLHRPRLFRDFRHARLGGETSVGFAERIERLPVPRATQRVSKEMMDGGSLLRGGILLLTVPGVSGDAGCAQDSASAPEHLEMREEVVFGRQDGGIVGKDEREVVLVAEHEIVAHVLHVVENPFSATTTPPFRNIHHKHAGIEVRSIWRKANELLVFVAKANERLF